MPQRAVIIYGPPGSGKSTQAELIAKAFGLVVFDTGAHIRRVLYDPAHKLNRQVATQRKRFEAGLLCNPPWVYQIVAEKIKRLIAAGEGVVLPGSPRTAYEAFGPSKQKGVYQLFADAFTKTNVQTILLEINPARGRERNAVRRVCGLCRRAYINPQTYRLRACPVCLAPLVRRTDDTRKAFAERINRYKEETFPIIDQVRLLGFSVCVVKGEAAPYRVFESIAQCLSLNPIRKSNGSVRQGTSLHRRSRKS